MKRIMIASHGRTASGMVSTISMFLPTTDITVIDAYVDDPTGNYDAQIERFLANLNPADEGYIFTDIYGGSVNQRVIDCILRAGKQCPVKLIANCNVSVIIEILTRSERLDDDEINQIIETAKPVLIIPESISSKAVISDDEFFG